MAESFKKCRLLLVLLFLLMLEHPRSALAGEALLSWDASTESDLAGYRVYVGLLPGVYGAPIDVGRVSAWTVPNLIAGGTYYFAVTAYDTAGNESGYSNEVSKTIPLLADLIAPLISSITASNRTMNSATISWGTDEPSDTRVEYGTSAAYGLSTSLATARVTAHSQSLSNLSPGTVYHYRVLSRDAAGNLAASADNTFTTLSDSTAPTVPGNVSGVALSSSQISLSWSLSSDNVGVTGYRIYRNGMQIASSTAVTYLDAGLTENTAYSYTVAAYDAAGNLSAQSAARTVTTLPLAPTLSQTAASGITAISATLSGVVNPSAAATSAWFEYGSTTAYGSSTPPVALSIESPLSANLTGLTAGSLYHFRLVARNAGGTTFGPDVVFNTPASPAPAPTPPPSGSISGYSLTQEPHAWVEAPTALTTFSGDDNVTSLSLPFSFPFYSQSYQQLYLSTNGLITFGAANSAFIPQPIPSNSQPNGFIAPFWRDLYVGLRQVSIASSASEFVISFNGVRDLCCSTTHSFQVILRPDGTILLQYGEIVLNAPTTFGIENQNGSAGVPVLSVASNTAFRLTPTAAPAASPPADTTAPRISGVAAGNMTGTSATVTWSTDEPADTQIEYGTTTAYGASTPVAATLLTSHSQNLTGLLPSTLYHYRMKSRDAAGNLAVSADATFTTAAPPAPVVSTPTSSNITTASATLSGSVDPSGATASAWFEYGATTAYGSSTSPVNVSTAGAISTPLSGLAPGTIYHFRLAARNTGGTTYSTDATFTTLQGDTTPPTVLLQSPTTGSFVRGTISIQANVADNVGVVKVEYLVDGVVKSTQQGTNLGSVSSPWNTTGLTDGVHRVMVRAFDLAGLSGSSPEISVTVDNTVPTAPGAPTATAVLQNQLSMTWSASTDAVSLAGYRVLRNGVVISTVSVASFADNGLTPNSSYTYTIIALDTAGNLSAASSPLAVTTLPQAPVISSAAASSITRTSATLTGSVDPAGAATSAWFEYGTTPAYGSNTAPVNLSTTTTLSANLTALVSGTTYHFRLVARNAGGTTFSPDRSFSTPAETPSPPTPTTGYSLTQEPHAWVEAPTPLTTFSGDDNVTSLSLPFSFPFYGQSYQQLYVSTNGLITLGAPNSAFIPQPIPSNSLPNGFIAPFWRDLYVGLGQISIASSDSEFVIAFNGVRDLCCSTLTHMFEVILRPDGTIILQYGAITMNVTTSIGIENQDGTKGVMITGVGANQAYKLTPAP